MSSLRRHLAAALASLLLLGALGARASEPAAQAAPKDADFAFDLLGAPAPPLALIDPALQEKIVLRRNMLTWHQGVGIGLVALTAGAMITGQLNYNDKFGGDATNRFKMVHSVFSEASLVAFTGAGLLAAFAPVPMEKRGAGFDRIDLHTYCMIGATAGMVAQLGLGLYTASREGYVNQSSMATTHLVIGYATLALMTAAVSTLIF